MKNHRILLLSIGIVAFLLISSIAYGVLNDRSPYDIHTGLGSGISVSPDGMTVAFSYYQDGKESIYKGNIDTGQATIVAESEEYDYRFPQFSSNGESLLYLAADSDKVQSIHHLENGITTVLTEPDVHVFNAAFSPDRATVYYAATPADDFLKPEGKKKDGADLFSVQLNSNQQQLTDKDAFSMESLSVSADGKTLYYSAFNGKQQLYAYDLEQGTKSLYLPEHFQGDIYEPVFSPDGKFSAYTAVANSSENGIYEYELFLMETSTGDTKRLTDYKASVTSPSFFHHEDRIAFLAQDNWPAEPAVFEAMTVDYDGHASLLNFSLPESTSAFQPAVLADRFVNSLTLAVLYLLLFGLLSVYFHSASGHIYLPTKISTGLTGIIFLGSFIAAAFDPWAGIGLFMLGIGLAGCTLAVFAFAFVFSRKAGRPV